MQQNRTYSKVIECVERHFSHSYKFYSVHRIALPRDPRPAAKQYSHVRPYPAISGVIVSDRTKTSGIRLKFTTNAAKSNEKRNESADNTALVQKDSTVGPQRLTRSKSRMMLLARRNSVTGCRRTIAQNARTRYIKEKN